MNRLVLLLLFILASCGPAFKVSYDYDKETNFGLYKTYSFTDDALALPADDLNRRRILSAVETELHARDLTRAVAGDLMVDLKLVTEQQQTANTTSTGGYGPGYAYHWGTGFSASTIDVQTYTEGTLIIDLIDNKKKQLVWHGRGTRTIDMEITSDQLDQRIREGVKQIMSKYPPVKK